MKILTADEVRKTNGNFRLAFQIAGEENMDNSTLHDFNLNELQAIVNIIDSPALRHEAERILYKHYNEQKNTRE